jgi:hypothetical protein
MVKCIEWQPKSFDYCPYGNPGDLIFLVATKASLWHLFEKPLLKAFQ